MYENVKIAAGPRVLSSEEEVEAAERELSVAFPTGYREYVTRFGEGVLGGSFVRIYPPMRILSELGPFHERLAQYWFWDEGRDVLTKDQALESVILGDTLDGDEIVFHPSAPERILVLPRESASIFVAGDGLPAAIEWLCSSGELTEPFEERDFEPFDRREEDDR